MEVVIELVILSAIAEPAAPALMNGSVSALVETLVIAAEDFESGNVRSAEEAEWLIDREAVYGIVMGAVLGPVDSFLDEITFLKKPWADSLLKGVMTGATVVDTGIGFRWLETLWMPQLTDEEKRDYIYNQKTMVSEFFTTTGMSTLLRGFGIRPKAALELETPTFEGGLKSISNLDDLLTNPDKLAGVSAKELYDYLIKNGYEVKPLSQGSLKGISFEEGGGFKVNWGGDRILQYHPENASHHGGAYYKISSGKTGTIRINLDGDLIQ